MERGKGILNVYLERLRYLIEKIKKAFQDTKELILIDDKELQYFKTYRKMISDQCAFLLNQSELISSIQERN